MPTIERHTANSISWVDLAAKDLDGAIGFYTDLMGWTTFNDGETDYHIFMNGDLPVAGAMAITPEMEGMPSVWSVYVAVNDADATLAEAEQLGGRIARPPFEIPGGGRIAMMSAPDMSTLCLFEGGSENGFKQIDEVGAPCWFDNPTRDADTAEEFYQKLFGWTAAPEPMEGGMDYRVLSHEGEQIAGIMAMGDMFPPGVPNHWAVTFSVADVDAAVEKTTSAGGAAMGPAQDSPYGRMAQLQDPWGATFGAIDRSTATA